MKPIAGRLCFRRRLACSTNPSRQHFRSDMRFLSSAMYRLLTRRLLEAEHGQPLLYIHDLCKRTARRGHQAVVVASD